MFKYLVHLLECLLLRQNIHRILQYLSDNLNVNVIGMSQDVTSAEVKSTRVFGKSSSRSRQIQKIVVVMKNFYCKVGKAAGTM